MHGPSVKHIPASKLLEYYSAVQADTYRYCYDSTNLDFSDEDKKSESKNKWIAICRPYATIFDILDEALKNDDWGMELKKKDWKFIKEACDAKGIEVERDDIEESLIAFGKRLSKAKDLSGRGEKIDSFCDLIELPFFHPTMDLIFKKHEINVQSEEIFCGKTRTKAINDGSCTCEWKERAKIEEAAAVYVRGCDACDPIEFLFSSETIRLGKTGYVHESDIFRQSSQKKDYMNFNKIRESFLAGKEIRQRLSGPQLTKIVATIFHIAGANSTLWDKGPDCIEDIWSNYPTLTARETLEKTVDELLENNDGWGNDNYIDKSNRIDGLRLQLNAGKIVTIHGEGGLGKTELVYQTLKRALGDKNSALAFDYLMPFTFKGKLQGEFDPSNPTKRKKANQKGWETTTNFHEMVLLLAREHDKNADHTDSDIVYANAVEFLIKNKVWLIIDNHEVQDKEGGLDKLLTLFLAQKDIQNSNTRIIITTRVTPGKDRPGAIIPIKGLSDTEMPALAKKRAIWLSNRSNKDDIQFDLHSETDQGWEAVTAFMRDELKTPRLEKTAGHPYVVFLAVYISMFGQDEDNRKSFTDILKQLISNAISEVDGGNDGPIGLLLRYIIGFSFNYMKTLNDEDDAQKYLELSNYDVIKPEDMLKIFQEGHRVCLQELENLEVLIRKSGDPVDSEYVFRTMQHRTVLREYIFDRWPSLQENKKIWSFWHGRMELMTIDSTLTEDSLGMIGIGGKYNESRKKTFAENTETLELKNPAASGEDALNVIGIVSYFGKLLNAIQQSGQRTYLCQDRREDFQQAVILFLKNTVDCGVLGLQRFIVNRIDSKKPLSPNILSRITRLLLGAHKILDNEAPIEQIYPEFGEDFHDEFYSGKTKHEFENLLQLVCLALPPNSKHTNSPMWDLWKLTEEKGIKGISKFTLGIKILNTGGIARAEEVRAKLLSIYHEDSGFENTEFSVEKISEKQVRPLGTYIHAEPSLIEETPGLLDFLRHLPQIVSADSKLFQLTSETIKITETGIKLSATVINDGDDITYLIYGSNHIGLNKGDIAHIGIIPYHREIQDEDQTLIYAIWDGLEVVYVDEEQEKLPDAPRDLIPIEEISKERMWKLLDSIEFQSISGAILFGIMLKEVLEKAKIENTGKAWKRWKKAHFMDEEKTHKAKKIVDIIPELSNNEWKVETGGGMDITIRRVPSVVKYLKQREERWHHDPDNVFDKETELRRKIDKSEGKTWD